jgi:hypothetical protein
VRAGMERLGQCRVSHPGNFCHGALHSGNGCGPEGQLSVISGAGLQLDMDVGCFTWVGVAPLCFQGLGVAGLALGSERFFPSGERGEGWVWYGPSLSWYCGTPADCGSGLWPPWLCWLCGALGQRPCRMTPFHGHL